MAHAATNILNALSDLDPAGKDLYSRNTLDTVTRLHALDRQFTEALAPVRQVPFITYHNAFPYLARRYGLRLVGVVEATASEEPSPRELARLNALVRGEKVRVLFIDGQPSRLARRLASDLGLTLATLETLETGTLSATAYEAGMRRNLDTLTRALGQSR
jgi:zinc/manganese transport system substrate-binding protein